MMVHAHIQSAVQKDPISFFYRRLMVRLAAGQSFQLGEYPSAALDATAEHSLDPKDQEEPYCEKLILATGLT
jgi:hypothetical protein